MGGRVRVGRGEGRRQPAQAWRGVEEAATSFYDPLGLEMPDEVHSKSEERWLRLALSGAHRLLVTIFVERADRVRIVSSRVANARERKQYEG